MKAAQNGFTGGEFSFPMYGRPDDSAYSYGVARARNFIVRPQGALRSRPGFEFVTTAKYSNRKVRLIPFQFNQSDTAILEFGHRYVRFIVDGAVVMDGDEPYEIESPYNESDLFNLHYDQSADVMTIVCTNYSPLTLNRYGAYDWRFETLDFGPKIDPPTDVTAEAYYPEQDEDTGDSIYGYSEDDKGRVESTYCVTAIDSDDNESERSDTATVKGNYYITGAYNEITWTGVENAVRYNVYRETGGIYAFIGETEETSIKDENISADTTKTPPVFVQAFTSSGSIKSVSVVDEGSGYTSSGSYYQIPNSVQLPLPLGWRATLTGDSTVDTMPDTIVATVLLYESTSSGETVSASLALEKYISDTVETCVYYLPAVSACTITPAYPSTETVAKAICTVTFDDFDNKFSSPGVRIIASTAGATLTYEAPESGFHCVNDPDPDTASQYSRVLDALQVVKSLSASQALGTSSGVLLQTVMNYTGQKITIASAEPVSLVVSDSTGSGANLTPIVSDGHITGVTVVSGGSDYTDPTVTATGGGGSGATFSVELYGDDDWQCPGALGLFEQRRWFAGTLQRPLSIWATRSGNTQEMSRHYPNVLSDDCIVVQAETRDANRILHIVPLQDLIMFTGSAEWRVSASDGGAITPSNISVKPQSYHGATEVQPIIAANQCVYATARGGHLREIGYSRDVYGYLSNDLSVRSTHLFDSKKIEDMTYLKAPFPRIVAVSSSGSLLVSTYMPEQSLNAWTHYTTQDGAFESCASVPEGDEDGEDGLYVAIRRVINGQTVVTIERMGIIEDNSDLALGLDCCLYGEFTEAQSAVGGLSHLEGMVVGALCDGVSYPNLEVRNGQVALPVAARHVVVGLPVDYELITLPFVTQMKGSGKGRVKNVSKVYLQVLYTGKLSVGPTLSQQTPIINSWHTRFSDEVNEDTIKEISCVPKGKWGELGQMVVLHTDYMPIEITSWAADVEIGS